MKNNPFKKKKAVSAIVKAKPPAQPKTKEKNKGVRPVVMHVHDVKKKVVQFASTVVPEGKRWLSPPPDGDPTNNVYIEKAWLESHGIDPESEETEIVVTVSVKHS